MIIIKIFKDQKDFEIVLTNDNIINIIGTKGSGKTTLSFKYIDNDNYIVINCDRLLELPSNEKEDKELSSIRNMLKKKYNTIPTDSKFINCYNDIVNYILNKNKTGVIEGNILRDIDFKSLRGKVIIKRTAIFKSFIRAVKRDYKNNYFMQKEKEKHHYFYKITRFYKITKRRKSIFKEAKDIDKIIKNEVV